MNGGRSLCKVLKMKYNILKLEVEITKKMQNELGKF